MSDIFNPNGVQQLIAGSGISVSPTGGTGVVTVSSSGGGAVTSVFGRTGTVTAQSGDYAAFYGQLSQANTWTGTNSFKNPTNFYIPRDNADPPTNSGINYYDNVGNYLLYQNHSYNNYPNQFLAEDYFGSGVGDSAIFSWSMIGRNDNLRRSYLNVAQSGLGGIVSWSYNPDSGYTLWVTYSGQVGVGQGSPSFALDIYDQNNTGTDIGNAATGAWKIDNTGVLYAFQAGVGLSGAAPEYALDINDVNGTGVDIGNFTTGLWNVSNAGIGTFAGINGGAGSFTTLAASSTVSGTGFSTYLASPPAIGATAANTGKFTTLQIGSPSVPTGSAFSFASSSASANVGIIENTSASGFSTLQFNSSAGVHVAEVGYGNASSSAPYTNSVYLYGNTSVPITFVANNALAGRVSAGGRWLFGTSTTDNSNGLLQLQSSTSASAGVAFGNDTPQASIYRSAASTLTTPGNFYIGTYAGTPTAPLAVITSSTNTFQGISTAAYSSSGGAAFNLAADSGAAVTSGSRVSTVSFGGATDASHTLVAGAAIEAFATQNWSAGNTGSQLLFQVTPNGSSTRATALTLNQDSSAAFNAKISTYNNIATAGWGVPAIYGSGRVTAQVAANASVAAYTVGAADGSFMISANVNVTASVTNSFTVTCAYTDETNTSRTLTLNFSNISGTLLTTITNVTGAGAYEGVPLAIRCKASTAITIATVGTFTSVTYNAEATISQIM